MKRNKPAIEKINPNDRAKSEKRGNEVVVIRWDLMERFIRLGLNGKEIAAKYGVSYNTLNRRCVKENGYTLGGHINNSPARIIAEFEEKKVFETVDRMLEAGCLGTEIAAQFELSKEYFYKIMRMRYMDDFAETRKRMRSKGDAMLKMKQFQLAMKGDRTLLVMLGKDRLRQTETHEVNINHKARVLTTEEAAEILKKLKEKY